MAFLRRGNITFPHKKSVHVALTRIDGGFIRLPLSEINCWEEYLMPRTLSKVVMVYHGLSSTCVQHTFDELSELINGKAVQP